MDDIYARIGFILDIKFRANLQKYTYNILCYILDTIAELKIQSFTNGNRVFQHFKTWYNLCYIRRLPVDRSTIRHEVRRYIKLLKFNLI